MLRSDSEFVHFIKSKIADYKADHANSSCNPHTILYAFKCTISGFCIQYSARKKKDINETKESLKRDIDLLKNGLANILNAQEIEESVEKIHQLENKLDEIYNYETAGSIVRALECI